MEQNRIKDTANLPFLLTICGVGELAETLARLKPSHVISITDPYDGDEIEFPPSTTVLRLAFFDVHAMSGMVARSLSASDGYPSIDHAQSVLDFGRRLPDNAIVLIHCWAGVSRSTAAAYLLVAQAMPGDELGAFDLIKSIRPRAQPNRLLVKFGDKLLGAGKRMVRCVDRGRP